METSLSVAVRSLWAKSGEESGHGLLCHMLDVAAVASVLLEWCLAAPETAPDWFGLPSESLNGWLAALVGLHDLGKATPGFQAKWEAGRLQVERAGLPFSSVVALAQDRHDLASAALLPGLLQAEGVPRLWAQDAAQAVSAHHGFNFTSLGAGAPLREPAIWKQTRQSLFQAYWHTLAPSDVPPDHSLPLLAVEWLAGLTSVCDWIGSNADWFPPGERGDTPSAHYHAARRLAESALSSPDKLGWPSSRLLLHQQACSCDAILARLLSAEASVQARPLQLTGDALLVQGSGPALMLVEAPMGEGKTELAFIAALRLQARQHHRGFYLALPTQATGNAMFERTLAFLRAFASGERQDIQLLHGGAAMNQTVAHLREIWDQHGNDAVGSSGWFAQRRRGLLSPYGVGTVDQALFSVLNVKHHFVRLWGLANKVVVLDEVHAYDTYTGRLIETLLAWLKALGCSVILMSATLPDTRRARLLQAWGVDERELPSPAYPRILLVDDAGARGATFNAREQQPIAVTGLPEGLDHIAAAARLALEQDGCGVVIVNTVDRAQQLYQLLRPYCPSDGMLLLFHARFPAEQRRQLEQQVLSTFGSSPAMGSRPKRALLIATQVAEQSLDIDFDFMISDLCPVDLLLQRAGRLHRHQRKQRPAAHAQPRLQVAGLLADVVPELEQTGWGRVYGDYLCLVTWAVLQNEPVWRLPQDIDRLVQAVYAPWPDLDHLPEALRERLEMVERTRHGAKANFQAQLAQQIALDLQSEAAIAYIGKPHGADEDDTLALRNRTRLGDDSLTVIPVWVDADGRWRPEPDGASFDPQQAVSDALAQRLFERHIKLSRRQLVLHLLEQPGYPALSEHPLLSHCHVLPLTKDGDYQMGEVRVSLDPRLGLIYGLRA
ncbi:CRISPR-associated helicase Cas3' [Chromobacterium rhizoryzae]|uniref:CRISPR-associated helicase Cas3' n=1 Tax=Chromobacterium rhizoryzae TaxID=1778675 RepID=UPI001D0863C2|nr:CRISPR-associated helicase Cas3' [Chromobacterium rhizoryzae]